MNYPKPEILALPALNTSAKYISVPGYRSIQRFTVYDEQINSGEFLNALGRAANRSNSSFNPGSALALEPKLKPWKVALTIALLIIFAPAIAFIISDIVKKRR